MAYVLGIDLGTSCTVAAINRAGGGTEVIALRVDTPGVPTVLHIADDGTMLVGAAAEPLMLSDPDHVFRGFLHRIDEPAPDPRRSPATLTARLVSWIVGTVTEQEGEPPQRITLTHPVGWRPGECRVLHDALIALGLAAVVLVPAPLATATAYVEEADGAPGPDITAADITAAGIAAGKVLAVYDLGATFSTSLIRCESDGIEDITVLGEPRGLEDGGGARFDELVLARVLDVLGDQVATADLDDQATLVGMAALLADCVTAREALSAQSSVTIPVALPGLDTRVQLTDDELEALLRPTLRATVHWLRAAISAARLHPADVDKVLISGGCARMPLVAQLLAAELGRPVAVLTDPELAAARGAALMAARPQRQEVVAAPPERSEVVAAPPVPAVPDEPAEERYAEERYADHGPAAVRRAPAPAIATANTVPIPRFHTHQRAAERHFRPHRRTVLAIAAGVLAVTTVVVPLTLLRASDSGATPAAVADGDPGRGDRAPAYGVGAAPQPRADTAMSPTADMPSAPPLAMVPTTPPPQPMVAVPPSSESPPAPMPPPTSTTRPPSTTTPPPTTTTPPPTSTTTPPPTTTTTPPPTTTTTPPPTSSTTTPPPTTTIPPP